MDTEESKGCSRGLEFLFCQRVAKVCAGGNDDLEPKRAVVRCWRASGQEVVQEVNKVGDTKFLAADPLKCVCNLVENEGTERRPKGNRRS